MTDEAKVDPDHRALLRAIHARMAEVSEEEVIAAINEVECSNPDDWEDITDQVEVRLRPDGLFEITPDPYDLPLMGKD